MEISLADLIDSNGEDIHLQLNPSDTSIYNDIRFLKDFQKLLREYDKPTHQIDYLITKLEENVDFENVIPIFDVDRKSIKKKIEKHPYFKNPCNYPIRLVTIMKYLKKKGVNIHYKDMDLIIDQLIQEMDGVKKIGDGMYLKKQNS